MIADPSTPLRAVLKPYPTMKDSDVPWLGEVPEHREICCRTLEEIRADILALEKETEGLLSEIIGGRKA